MTIATSIVMLASGGLGAQVLRLAEMRSDQIRALDRQRTVVVIPGGILEEHGPYLPTYTDGFADAEYTRRLAQNIAAQGAWTVLIAPEIPLGFGGANNMGEKWDCPGSLTVRFATLRAVYMDLAGALGEQGFRWIVVVHDHGDPAHNRALDQAADYFHDAYRGTMLHLFGLTEVQSCYGVMARMLGTDALKEDGISIHAGAEESSEMLFLRPDLVPPSYKTAKPLTGATFTQLYDLAAARDWPGYFGAPARGSRAIGSAVIDACATKLAEVTTRVLRGEDYRGLSRFYDTLDPRDALGDKAELAHDRAIAAKESTWVAGRLNGRGR